MKLDISKLKRGLWVWQVNATEGGDIFKIIDKCHECHISWLIIKSADIGRQWKQFTPALVKTLKDAGIRVFSWSYDIPDYPKVQAEAIKAAADMGSEGHVIDAEIEWEQCTDPDGEAQRYIDEIRKQKLPESFVIGDAPWPIIGLHQKFPFTTFGKFVDFRLPQIYFSEMGLSPQSALMMYGKSWSSYEWNLASIRKVPEAIKPKILNGSTYSTSLWTVTNSDIAYFEQQIKHDEAIVFWDWQSTPNDIWELWKRSPF